MSKSLIRKRAAEIWPEAWHFDRRPEGVSGATLVVIDAMQTVRGLNHNGKTWRDLSERMLADLKMTRSQYPLATTFIYSFDTYPFVPMAKAPVQQQRTEQADMGEPEELTDFVCGPLDTEVPDDWTRAVHHRAVYLREIIRFFVLHWRTKSFPATQTIIVDGHYLKPEDFPECELSANDVLKTPVYLSPGDFALAPELMNELGEGDFAMPFLMKSISEDHDICVVLSIDTDMMSILLTFETHLKIFWRFWPRLSFVPNTNGYGSMTGANTQKWCDVSSLKEDILNDQRLAALGNPLGTLCAAVASSGGDYTDPIRRVTPQRFIDTLLVNARYIGDVCDEDGIVDPDAHRRLIRCACSQAALGNKSLFKASENADFDNKLAPIPTDVLHRRRHLQYYMTMLSQTGGDKLILDNPRFFGYARIDRTQELSRDNIMRLHGTDAPDDLFQTSEVPSKNLLDDTS